MANNMNSAAFLGAVLHFIDDPSKGIEGSYQYFPEGLLWVAEGRVKAVGEAKELLPQLPEGVTVTDYRDHLLMPGFIDTHIHYPQTEMIAAHGSQLLEWLQNYTFPTEKQFKEYAYAEGVAELFLDELLRNGTTTALVFATVHPESVDAFFTAAQSRQLRMIAGKVLMDRNAPEYLLDTPELGYQQSSELIERWHGKERLLYAVTPRFAPTSSDQQLRQAAALLNKYEGLYLHTHLSENQAELAWVSELFPESANYLDVYDQAGLLGQRSVFAHGIHLCDEECQRLEESQSAVAHCPSSNLFLGSGLFKLEQFTERGIPVGIGTDVGAGTSFSMLQTLSDGYKVQQLRGHSLDPFQALYMATLGGAKALSLDHCIGSFNVGNEADFIVLDLRATPLMSFRTSHCHSLSELLFSLLTLGDDRAVAATYIMGELAHRREM